jgi:hypothetical protein
MKKTFLILSIIALIASGCGNKATEKSFDLATFPSEWRSLITENGELTANDSPFSIIVIGNGKFTQHFLVRVDETGHDDDVWDCEIVKTSQRGDTIVFSMKSENHTFDYYFIWLDKDKGLGKWILGEKSGYDLFVVMDREAEYLSKKDETANIPAKDTCLILIPPEPIAGEYDNFDPAIE